MSHISTAIRVVSATWLVVVLCALLIGIPYIMGRGVKSSPMEDPVVQIFFLLVATSIPAAFGLAYASHRRSVEETEEWLDDLR